MIRTRWLLGLLGLMLLVVSGSGCNLLDGGGGGTGGGSGTVPFDFQKGFTFVRKDDRNVFLVDASDTSTLAALTSSQDAKTPAFRADGARIVFVRGTSSQSQLATVSTQGGAISTVLTATVSAKNFRTPVFSPDGTRIAFAYDDGISSSIGLVNADGTDFVKLVGGGALAYASPSFSNDGQQIYAAAGNAGLSLNQIESVAVSTGAPTNLTNTLGNEAMGISGRMALSPDGTKLVFDATIASGVTRIFVIDVSTKAVTKINEYTAEPNTSDTFPCWVNSTTIAYSSNSGGNDAVYQIGVTGIGRQLVLPKAIEPFYGSKR